MSNERDNREIVIEEIRKYGGLQKQSGDWIMVCCPFHSDSNPSCGVNVAVTNTNRIGFFNCLGCGEKGPFNKFATQAGLQQIKEWKSSQVHVVDQIDPALEQDLLGVSDRSAILSKFGAPEAQPWPQSMNWRGFSGRLINRAGGLIALDRYNDSIAVIFIVEYAGVVRGGVKASYYTTSGKSSYITSKGQWVNHYGVLFLKQARTLITKNDYNFILVVEGPRDALRLLSNGLPAVAILGASTMTKRKAMLLTTLNVDKAYIMPDNDSGGETFWAGAKKVCRPLFKTQRISLPKVNEHGKLVKIDPGNMSQDLLDELILTLTST